MMDAILQHWGLIGHHLNGVLLSAGLIALFTLTEIRWPAASNARDAWTPHQYPHRHDRFGFRVLLHGLDRLVRNDGVARRADWPCHTGLARRGQS